MLDTLRAWLNGKREYWGGVTLYAILGVDAKLLETFKKGPTEVGITRLHEELIKICRELKQQQYATAPTNANTTEKSTESVLQILRHPPDTISGQQRESTSLEGGAQNIEPTATENTQANEALYEACKKEADDAYKALMNKRAVLFSLAPADDLTDPNTPDRIEARRQLSIDIVKGYQHVSELYERADHVKLYGRLPDQQIEKELDVDALPDHQVKQQLDNARKRYNKLKNRDQTPERIVLLQKHEADIAKLEERWKQLKQPA